jgi:phage portal protein BeeE
MRITKNRKDRKLWLSHDGCPKVDKEKEEIQNVSYASVVGSLMHAMVCTRSDIANAVGVVSRFLSNHGKMH